MPKATTAPGKKTVSARKSPASRASVAPGAEPETSVTLTQPTDAVPPATLPEPNPLLVVLERLTAVEAQITSGFVTLAEEVRALKAAPPAGTLDADVSSDTVLPLLTDVLRRHLMEQLSPVTAGLKRLEERIGFVANRLKHGASGGGGGGGGGQERQKPWRNEQSRHPRQRSGQQNGQPRPAQGQPPSSWTPPSAASVQGHFAPRPLPGRGLVEEED